MAIQVNNSLAAGNALPHLEQFHNGHPARTGWCIELNYIQLLNQGQLVGGADSISHQTGKIDTR